MDPDAIRQELDAVLSMARTVTWLFPPASPVTAGLNFLQKLVDTPGAIEAVIMIINDIEAIPMVSVPPPTQVKS